METVAIYWEEKVKIYGITVKQELVLVSILPNDGSVAALADLAAQLSEHLEGFILSTCQMLPRPQLDVVLPKSSLAGMAQQLARYVGKQGSDHFTVTENVSILSLHGPHFQERFGVAEVAVTALQQAGVPVLLNCCTGTSLQLVVAASWCQTACDILQQTFVTPSSV